MDPNPFSYSLLYLRELAVSLSLHKRPSPPHDPIRWYLICGQTGRHHHVDQIFFLSGYCYSQSLFNGLRTVFHNQFRCRPSGSWINHGPPLLSSKLQLLRVFVLRSRSSEGSMPYRWHLRMICIKRSPPAV